MSLFEAQLIVLFLLLIGTFICGTLPILCFRCLNCFSGGSTGNKVTSFLIFFGGGVLFATSLLHLLPEAREQLEKASHQPPGGVHHLTNTKGSNGSFEKCNGTNVCSPHQHHGHEHSFSFPEFIALCGFFATYLIEEIIRSVVLRKNAEKGTSDEERIKFCSCAQRNTECSRTFKDLQLDRNDLLSVKYGKRKRSSTWAGQGNQGEGAACSTVLHDPPPDLLKSSVLSQPYPNYGATEDVGSNGLLMRLDGGITLVNRPVATPPQPDVPEIVISPETPLPEGIPAAGIAIGTLLTVAALSFHSVFEGIAMGFQPTAADTWTLFFAVALHKFVIAFVIGVETVTEKSGTPFVLACMGVFSIMAPIGIGIAMALGAGGSSVSQFAVGVVNCIVTGTLLYVTFFEILRRKCQNFCGLRRFAATISGFLLMSGLLYATTKM